MPSIPATTPARASARLGLAAAIAMAIATVALLKPQADASGTSGVAPTSVATVNLVSVITQLDEFNVIDKKIKADGEKKKAEIETLSKEIEAMQEDLKRLDPNSDAYDEIFRQLNMKAGFRELRGTMLIRWQSEDNARVLTELYEKALTAVADVAKRDGWDVVIHTGQQSAVPRNPNIRAEQAMDFVEDWIQSRRVIYSSDAVDISSTVVKQMNNRYQAGG